MSVERAQKSGQQRGGLREAQRRFTRQHILDAAVEVFVEQGYTATTVEDIIERAGTSRGTFYAHFRSKTDVIVELSMAVLPEIQDSYRRLDEVLVDGSWDALRGWLASTIEWCVRYGGLMPVWEQAAATEAEHRAKGDQVVQSLPDLMPRYLARWPKGRRDEARLRIVLLDLQLDRFFAHSPPRFMDAAEREFVADVLTNIWYESLKPPPSGPGGQGSRARSAAAVESSPAPKRRTPRS
jgi:AcrR family transcriptional regulator